MRRSSAAGLALFAVLAAGLLPAAEPVLGEGACIADEEPNDTLAEVLHGSGPICVEGTLPAGDQDLLAWEVPPDEARTRWTFSVDGVPGTLTALKIFEVTSAPGVEPMVSTQTPFLEVAAQPGDAGTAVLEDVLLGVGRYLLGISRSEPVAGGEVGEAAYRYAVARGRALPPSGDVEPNDEIGSASAVADAFEISGDLAGSIDHYRWEVTQPGQLWDVALTVPQGDTVWLEVQDAEGRSLVYANTETLAGVYDLDLGPGTYVIRVRPATDEVRPYILRATPSMAGADPEPNDELADAVALTEGAPLRGRLARSGDRDLFSLSVPSGDHSLRDARLLWRSGLDRSLCLLGADGLSVTCEDGTDGVALTGLLLPPGDSVFEVRGRADPGDTYLLRVDRTGPAVADFEAEPNDDVKTATRFDPMLGMRARGDPRDQDVYRFHVDGEPQLWQVDMEGSQIESLTWITADGSELGSAQVSADRTLATLDDLYLVPGEHWLRVRVDGLEYSLAARPLGPPDPDGEREPNSDPVRAEGYRIGARKVGRLPNAADHDLYRFTLAAPQHIALRLAQPEAEVIEQRLWRTDDLVSEWAAPEPGSVVTWDLWLQPGDYVLELLPRTPGEGKYELTSERRDPFDLAVDQEPNDSPDTARTVPDTLRWSGTAAGTGDQDWYLIPALDDTADLHIRVDDEEARVRLMAGTEPVGLEREEGGGYVASGPPPGLPLYLRIDPVRDYRVELAGGGLVAAPEPASPPLTVAWDMPVSEVAAYWPEEQRLESALHLVNEGPEPLVVDLQAATSHYLWSVELEPGPVSIPTGSSLDVPASVRVQPDAWAGDSVLVSVQARTPQGGTVRAATELRASGDAPAVAGRTGWPLPDALLGGLNVASLGLGAVPGGTLDADMERELFDGVTPDGSGFAAYVDDYAEGLPIDLVVDLAGDEPVPIAGTILNPQARDGRLAETPRDFEISLSTDGVDWEPALRGRLSPLPVEQSFVLPEPVMATQARLRIISAHTDDPFRLALGEWKVIATPGATPRAGPLNIAEADLGGHLVRFEPFTADQRTGSLILGAEPTGVRSIPVDDSQLELVVGFQDDRAAQITRLEWQDPEGSDPAQRVDGLDVEVTTQGPVGPWQRVGRWELERDALGDVAPFELPRPTWARFVRLSGTLPSETRYAELPGTVRIYERAPGADYRSVFGEWGYRSSRGPLEWLGAGAGSGWELADDAGDDATSAAPLRPGVTATDRVEIDVDEDWFAIETPPRDNAIQVVVQGRPSVGVALTLFDPAGVEQPMTFDTEADGSVRYQASVEPGSRYLLRVRQPPFSAVFTFDTSGSMGPFLDIVRQGMRTFADEVRPGREAVMIVPFEEAPLIDDWEDDAYLLQDAVNNHRSEGGSSGAEAGLIAALDLLAGREGARAILLVTDAETSSYQLSPQLWEALDRVRPIVFSVHVGALGQPVRSRQMTQDWAAVAGGQYTYPTTNGEMDRAFDRMATWLRRPAQYRLGYSTADLSPGTLAVVAPNAGAGDGLALAPGVGIEVILDTSSSMNRKLGGRRRIDIAKSSLRMLLGQDIAPGVPLAIRTFGGPGRSKKARCQTRLTLPLRPLDRAKVLRTVKRLKAGRKTATPIATALASVADDLATVEGLHSVVLVTDGKETCGGDPAAVIAALRESGIDVSLDIVGLALEDEALKDQMAAWAEAGGGTYFDATGAAELATSLAMALSAPFRIYAPDGSVSGAGTVGGAAVEIGPGSYRVEVLTDPPVVFDEVVVGARRDVTLELPEPDQAGS